MRRLLLKPELINILVLIYSMHGACSRTVADLLTYRTLLPSIYSLYTEAGKDELKDVVFDFEDREDPEYFKEYAELILSKHNLKMKYLAAHYRYVETDSGFEFARGCLKSLTKDGVLTFRRRSEWFRKLPTDLLFAQGLARCSRLHVAIPNLWIRNQDLPVIGLWAKTEGVSLLVRHIDKINTLLSKYTLENVVANRHSITRRYFLRYYYKIGAISQEQFMLHKGKTSRQMKDDPCLSTL